MKVFRSIIAIVLVLSLIFALSACSSKKEKLVGTWEADGYSFTFNSDGTCKMGFGGYSVDGTYKVDGDKLSLTFNGETESMTIDSVDGSKLVLVDGNETVTFTKK